MVPVSAASGGDSPPPPACALGAEGEVHWLLDGKLVAISPAATPIEHHFTTPGRHRLLALDSTGAYAAVEVRVLGD